MKTQLVLQFDGASMDDFDALLALEFELGLGLGSDHVVEGHQIGAGKLSLMIATDCPESALELSKKLILKQDSKLLNGMVAAYKAVADEAYTVLCPESSKDSAEGFCLL